jgi:hypothetical protein
MRKRLLFGASLFVGMGILLTAGAPRAAAQGPAGTGAVDAAQDNTHSLNPMHWIKKDSGDATDALGSRIDVERKLTPILQSEGALPANSNAHDACATFADLERCVEALHATHDLGLNFACVQASVTGVHTSADLSGCKDVDGDQQQSLKEAIHILKPEANAKEAVKAAEQEAKADLAKLGG